jgi:hypothetical protein
MTARRDPTPDDVTRQNVENVANLSTYVHDHLAGARFAIELLKGLSEQKIELAAAEVATELLPQIESDRLYLERFLERRGGEAKSLRNLASWFAERVSRLKLNLSTPLGVFEAVEFLCLGILGKLALWNALQAAGNDEGTCLAQLKARAAEQHSRIEAVRLKLAASLFAAWNQDAPYVRHEETLIDWARHHGIDVGYKRFPDGKAGEFDGLTVFMNPSYESRERLYYAVHAIGSIVIWCRDRDAIQQVFNELREAKKHKSSEPDRFVAAIERYRRFETESSDYAVWILQEIGAGSEIPAYTNLMRADLEAMTQFHEIGQAPVWNEFFARWNSEVTAGERTVNPFEPKRAKDFHAVKIETQEILQRQ